MILHLVIFIFTKGNIKVDLYAGILIVSCLILYHTVKKLKIALFVDVFPSVSETFILNQITYLIDQGHQLTIYSRVKGSGKLVHDQILKYQLLEKTIYLPPRVKSYSKRIREILRSVFVNKDINFVFEILKCLNFVK